MSAPSASTRCVFSIFFFCKCLAATISCATFAHRMCMFVHGLCTTPPWFPPGRLFKNNCTRVLLLPGGILFLDFYTRFSSFLLQFWHFFFLYFYQSYSVTVSDQPFLPFKKRITLKKNQYIQMWNKYVKAKAKRKGTTQNCQMVTILIKLLSTKSCRTDLVRIVQLKLATTKTQIPQPSVVKKHFKLKCNKCRLY